MFGQLRTPQSVVGVGIDINRLFRPPVDAEVGLRVPSRPSRPTATRPSTGLLRKPLRTGPGPSGATEPTWTDRIAAGVCPCVTARSPAAWRGRPASGRRSRPASRPARSARRRGCAPPPPARPACRLPLHRRRRTDPTAPDDQHRRLMRPQPGLPGRVGGDVGLVVVEQVRLDRPLARLGEVGELV